MDLLRRKRVLGAGLVTSCLLVFACGPQDRYQARGTVYDVKPDQGSVLIDHEAIPGFMDAMTMTFDVRDPELLARLSPGQVIEFEIDASGRGYAVVSAEVVGEASEEDGWVRFGDALVLTSQAPSFELVDQEGEPFSSRRLMGKAALVDFIFTQCPGPCPLQTAAQVSVQRAIDPSLVERVRFVSISLDPRNDTPAALREYALARGADLSAWSFLTGDEEEVAAVVKGFGVGTTRAPDGTIDHMLIRFLLDGEGRVVKRYFGSEIAPEVLAGDVARLLGG